MRPAGTVLLLMVTVQSGQAAKHSTRPVEVAVSRSGSDVLVKIGSLEICVTGRDDLLGRVVAGEALQAAQELEGEFHTGTVHLHTIDIKPGRRAAIGLVAGAGAAGLLGQDVHPRLRPPLRQHRLQAETLRAGVPGGPVRHAQEATAAAAGPPAAHCRQPFRVILHQFGLSNILLKSVCRFGRLYLLMNR